MFSEYPPCTMIHIQVKKIQVTFPDYGFGDLLDTYDSAQMIETNCTLNIRP